ncbi:MAG: YggS family pyridoxal phosphate-dependent enzyme [Candidatus Acidiferrales bacterium]
MPPENNAIAANLERVREQIAGAAQRAGRRTEDVTIVAVSKTFPPEAVRAAYGAGLRHFGENRVQEFETKQPRLADIDATWHFIGHLQSNKARRAANLFDSVDSVDSVALGQKLDSAATAENKRLPILIEVHLGGEQSKSGVAEAEISALAESLLTLPHLELRGLMAIPPYFDDPERVRPYFRELRELRDDLSRRIGHPLPVLSMGMSHDFKAAIEEGASEIRLGTALFGERL